MTDDFEVKSEAKYKVGNKSEVEKDVEDAGDKLKAGAKAVGNKIQEASRDLDTEYKKEKFKEEID